jgi:protein-tyrosine kinase
MTLLFTPQELQPASASKRADSRRLGEIFASDGLMTGEAVAQTLALQQRAGIPFGEAAIRLSFIDRAQLQRALSQQFDYAVIAPGGGGFSPELATAYEPFGAQAEAVRRLRTELLLRWFNGKRRVLAVTSADRGDGRSYLSANLAVSFSQMGERTLLIDCDMRNPRQHELFNITNRIGLSSLLGGRLEEPSQAMVEFSELPCLTFMPAGPIPPNPLELLGQTRFSNLLSDLAVQYDAIVLDTPAAVSNADGQVIASRAGGTLVISRKDQSSAKDMRHLIGSLTAAGTQIVGMAFNRH